MQPITLRVTETISSNLDKRTLEEANDTPVEGKMRPNALNSFVMNLHNRPNTTSIPEAPISPHVLRQFSVNYAVARACIDYVKTQLTQLEWAVVPVKEEDMPSDSQKATIQEIENFFHVPSGPNSTFRKLQEEMIEDYLVIGSITLERIRTVGEDLLSLLPVDSATIKVRLEESGTIPSPPNTAYEQWIRGVKTGELTTDEMIFEVKNNRTNSPFGLSPLESLILQVQSALAGELYNYRFFTDSNVPEGMIGLPVEWSLDQVKDFQAYWDNMIAGNPRKQQKVKFVPGDIAKNYVPTKKAEDMAFEKFELWLLQQTCAVFGVPPQDLGFTHDTNKSTSDTQKELGQERAKIPTAKFLEEVFTKIVMFDLGYPDYKFTYLNVDPVDKVEEAEIDTLRIRAGITSVDEVRMRDGLEPVKLDNYVMTGKGPVLVKDIVSGKFDPMAGGVGGFGGESTGSKVSAKPAGDSGAGSGTKTTSDTKTKMQTIELKQWKKCAIKDIKKERPFRPFTSSHIDEEIVKDINKQLAHSVDRVDISKTFDLYLNGEYDTVMKLRKLSDVLETYDK